MRMIQRMTGPEAISANALAQEVGVHQTTLSSWLREASYVGDFQDINEPYKETDHMPAQSSKASGLDATRKVSSRDGSRLPGQ